MFKSFHICKNKLGKYCFMMIIHNILMHITTIILHLKMKEKYYLVDK